jgi:hypothetical protein
MTTTPSVAQDVMRFLQHGCWTNNVFDNGIKQDQIKGILLEIRIF